MMKIFKDLTSVCGGLITFKQQAGRDFILATWFDSFSYDVDTGPIGTFSARGYRSPEGKLYKSGCVRILDTDGTIFTVDINNNGWFTKEFVISAS